MERTEEFCWNI